MLGTCASRSIFFLHFLHHHPISKNLLKNEKSKAIKSRFDARGKWHHKGYWVVTGQSSLLGIWSSWPDLFCRSKAKRSSIIKKLDVQIFFLSISWLKLPCFGIWRRFNKGKNNFGIMKQGRSHNAYFLL